MSIDTLRQAMPAYAKDISLNLSSLMNETILTDQQKWGCFIASAYAVGAGAVIRALEDGCPLTPEALTAAKAAAAIMGMNNIYYRALHLMHNREYSTLPAKLRMHRGLGHQRLRHVPGQPRGRTAQTRRLDPGHPDGAADRGGRERGVADRGGGGGERGGVRASQERFCSVCLNLDAQPFGANCFASAAMTRSTKK
jgi:hypothetical protein